jgi:hypothetical protein
VNLLVNKQIHKFTKDHCGTVPIGWCLLYFRCFRMIKAFTKSLRHKHSLSIPILYIALRTSNQRQP